MEVIEDVSGRVFELHPVSRLRDDSNHLPSSDHVHLGDSSSTLGDELDDPVERRGKERYTLYTPEEERAVVKKLDRNLVLFVAFLYMLSFLDRSSISPFDTWRFEVDS